MNKDVYIICIKYFYKKWFITKSIDANLQGFWMGKLLNHIPFTCYQLQSDFFLLGHRCNLRKIPFIFYSASPLEPFELSDRNHVVDVNLIFTMFTSEPCRIGLKNLGFPALVYALLFSTEEQTLV